MRRHITLFILLLTAAAPLCAQNLDLPPGKWWERPRIVEHLSLSDKQLKAIEARVFEHARRMIDLNAAVERTKLELRQLADGDAFDPAALRECFAAFQEARRSLEYERFEMVLSVRQTMSTEQWRKMMDLRERLDGMKRMSDRPGPVARPDRRPPGRRPGLRP